MEARIDREKRIVSNMILLYCKDHHNSSSLCETCNTLQEYTFKRLISCPFEKDKPACSKCTNHCYNKTEKKKINEVMRYAGPKMLLRFPKDTILYYYDKLRYINYTIK